MGNTVSNIFNVLNVIKDTVILFGETLFTLVSLLLNIIKSLEPVFDVINLFFKGLNWLTVNFLSIFTFLLNGTINFFRNILKYLYNLFYEIFALLYYFVYFFNLIIEYINFGITFILSTMGVLFGLINYAADEDILF
jgi:hypothetical protein